MYWRSNSIQTRLQGIEQDTWLYFYPSVSQPTMICTVRRKQCHVSVEQNMYVPFLIVDHIIPDQLFQLHQLLLKDALTSGMVKVAHLLKRMDDVFLAEEVQKKSLLVSWFSQTTDLVLTSWLMKRFLHEVKGVGEDEVAGIWKDAIDWNQLCGNFRSFNAEKQTYNETLDALKELWSWDPVRPLEEYFDIYTYKAKALSVDWMNLIPPVTPIELGENSPLVQCIEDTISMIGLEAEQNAYTLYGSGLSFSDEALTNWGDNHSIDTLLSKIHALDRFVRLKNVWMLENDMHIHQAQIYIALLICLNWDVQRVLFKSIKNQAGNQVKNMMQELYSRYIEDLLKSIPVNVPAWLLEPLPESKDHCLADRCYADLWQESNQYFF